MSDCGSGPRSPPDDDRIEIRRRFSWPETPPSTAVIETLAEAAETTPTAIEPLYAAVDPDALDELIQSGAADDQPAAVTVSLTFAGYLVTVHGSGEVVVKPARETRRPDA